MVSRRDNDYRALRGSQCQMQLYVNAPERRRELDAKVLRALPTLREEGVVRLDWRSPLAEPVLAGDHPFHEYRDGKVFDAIGRSDLRSAWSRYWPTGSQTWDGIAVAYGAGDTWLGPVLVEAKSYPGEFRPSSGGSAAEEDRLDLIVRRLRETREWLGVEETSVVAALWNGPLYQSANRFATLRFFRDPQVLDPPVRAWVLNLYFVDDRTHRDLGLATSRAQWEQELTRAEADLGLDGASVPHSGHAFVDAGTYDQLVAATSTQKAPR